MALSSQNTRTINKMNEKKIISYGKEVIQSEIESLQRLLKKSIDKNFVKLVELILNSNGKVVMSGVGKSGIIAQKISSTLISTGTPSIFIHPVEAMHGDLGMIFSSDILILLSNSGNTVETNRLASIAKKKKAMVVAITNNEKSKIKSFSDLIINTQTLKEASPDNIVPTSSTTAMIAFGDALAITLMRIRGYNSDDFAKNHPGGNLGRLLYLKVGDIMRIGMDNPVIKINSSIAEAIRVMSITSLGAVSVVDLKNRLVGFFTDGDIRRKFGSIAPSDMIEKHMTKNPVSIRNSDMAIKAAEIMQRMKIDNLPVVDDRGRVVGIVDERDLIKEGMF